MSEFKVKNNRVFSAVRILLSLLLGILTAAFIICLTILYVLRFENVINIAKKTDVTEIISNAGIYREIAQVSKELLMMSEDVDAAMIAEFINSGPVSNELHNIKNGYINAFIDNDFKYHLSVDDVVELVRKFTPEIQEHLDHTVTEEQLWELSVTLGDTVDMEELSVERMMDTANVDPVLLTALFSIYPLLITGVLIAICLFNIFFINRRKMPAAFCTSGLSILLPGIILFIAGYFIPSLLRIPGGVPAALGGILSNPAHMITQYGLACIAAGVLLIVVSIIYAVLQNRRGMQDYRPVDIQDLKPLDQKMEEAPAHIEASGFTQTQEQVQMALPATRKSKAPIFIGLGINGVLTVLLIIFIVSFLGIFSAETAESIEPEIPAPVIDSNLRTLTFEANGGSWLSGRFESRTVSVDDGSSVGARTPHSPEKPGYIFIDWVYPSMEVYSGSQPVTEDNTVYAMWLASSMQDEHAKFLDTAETIFKGRGVTVQSEFTVSSSSFVVTGATVTVSNDDYHAEVILQLDRWIEVDSIFELHILNDITIDIVDGGRFIINNDAKMFFAGTINNDSNWATIIEPGGELINKGIINNFDNGRITIRGLIVNEGEIHNLDGSSGIVIEAGGAVKGYPIIDVSEG